MPAHGLVGGDAGSMRQAAPYKPGESKAGAIQEGWTEDQLDQMLENEVRHAACIHSCSAHACSCLSLESFNNSTARNFRV
jgi:hypothetical protein